MLASADNTSRSYSSRFPLSLLEETAACTPDAPAVLSATTSLTYSDVATAVADLVDDLGHLGLGTGDRIMVALPDGIELGLVVLALMSGAVCCPVNAAGSEWEHARYIQRLKPSAVITRPHMAPGVRNAAAAAGIPIVELDVDRGPGALRLHPRPRMAAAEPELTVARASADECVLVLPTSGTTGESRLIGLTAPNVLAAATASCRAYGLTAADRRLNIMPMFHVQGIVGSLVTSLVAGGSVVCLTSPDPATTAKALVTTEATWFSGSPTMYDRLLALPGFAPAASGQLPQLRFLRTGSAGLDATLRVRLEDAFGLPVTESYGMTEAHQIASTELCRPRAEGLVPTGSEVRLLDEHGRLVWEPGVTGELVISGPNVTLGNLGVDPMPPETWVDGWLRTGDIGRVLQDGSFAIPGRLKEMINRGGERIAPREVELVLADHPAVKHAAVFGLPDSSLGEVVAAAIGCHEQCEVTDSDLIAFAAGRLSAQKVPRLFFRCAELPVTATGKVRRAALAEMMMAQASEAFSCETETVFPPLQPTPEGPLTFANPVEAALSEVWRGILGHLVDTDTDFFRTGADSLALMNLVGQVEVLFGVVLDPIELYDEASTIQQMAALIERRTSEAVT